MVGNIHVLIECADGSVASASLEALAFAQRVARSFDTTPTAVVLGADCAALAAAASGFRVRAVTAVEHERLSGYDPDLYSEALRQAFEVERPELFVMPDDYRSIDLAPRLSAVLRTALVTGCVGYRKEGEDVFFVRQMYQGKLEAEVSVRSAFPWLLTVQRGVCAPEDAESGDAPAPVSTRVTELAPVPVRRIVLDESTSQKVRVDLGTADIIVAVGRGLKQAANLGIIEELAAALGAEIGATRPAVDNEWVERDRQIGSSGQTVSPKLYIGCGISGAVYHVVGMKQSKCIVAIDTDSHAPIFNVATYGIVGDLLEVVPALTRQLRLIASK